MLYKVTVHDGHTTGSVILFVIMMCLFCILCYNHTVVSSKKHDPESLVSSDCIVTVRQQLQRSFCHAALTLLTN